MPLDPQVEELMDQVAALGLPPAHTVSPAEARANAKARPRAPGPEVAKVEDRRIPSRGPDVPVRIYTPAGSGPFPVLIWLHGGGWVTGDLDTVDPSARRMAVGGQCVVVSVDYRLSPETKFPDPTEDCYAATQWAVEHASELNGDPARIAIGGESAGANLAAGVCLMAKDRGGPNIGWQLLVYPVTSRDFQRRSYQQNGDGYQLTSDTMKWYWEQFLASDADASNPYAAPLEARDLAGQPPALVITAEYDPLRDEGEAYAQRLQEAGVATHYTCYDGMIHGFFGMAAALDKGQQAVDEACLALRAAVGAGAGVQSL